MSNYYWTLNSKIQKSIAVKKTKSKKDAKIIKDRILSYFKKKNQYKQEYGPLNQSPDLLYVVELVCQFYQTEGKDLPHTTTCIERYSLMILANYNPEKHSSEIMKFMYNKFKKTYQI